MRRLQKSGQSWRKDARGFVRRVTSNSLEVAYLFIFFLLTCFIVSPAFSAFTDQTALRLPAATDNSYSQTVADIDGDSDSDLLVNNSGQSRLLINDGSGVFDDQTSFRLPALEDTLIDADFGDVDGDGDLDLALASVFGQNRVFINDGTGTFADESLFRLPFDSAQSMAVKLRDLDGDGDLDMVVANRDGRNRILINDGSGNFADESTLRLPADTDPSFDLEVADLNGDGTPDLLIANQGTQNRLLVNNGLGVFSDETALRLPVLLDTSLDLLITDIDGDGDPDLILAEGGEGLRLLINNGSGVFNDESGARLPALSDYVVKVNVADADADYDGDDDLILANMGQDRLLLNDGTGVFSDGTGAQLPVDTSRTFSLLPQDVENDFDADLQQANPQGQNRLLINEIAFPRTRITISPDYIEAGDTVTITEQTFDEDGVASVVLTINGIPVPLVGGVGLYVPPAAGDYTALITSEDTLGNVGTRSRDFHVFTQDIVDPTDDRTVADLALEVDGAPHPLDVNGDATYVSVVLGPHNAVATAHDAAGNEGSDTVVINVLADTESPTVGVTALPDPVDLLNLVTISVNATDNVAVSERTAKVTGPGDPGGLDLALDAAGESTYIAYQPGTYVVDASARDPAGNVSTNSTSFEAVGIPDATPPTITLTIDPYTVALGDPVTLTVIATDDVGVAERTLEINGTPVPLDAGGSAVYTPPVLGTYNAVAVARDATGNESTALDTFQAVDPAADTTAPVAAITSPLQEEPVNGFVNIDGTVSDETLVEYTLSWATLGTADFTLFHTGYQEVAGGNLGVLDTTLMETGFYQVRLVATDINGLTTEVLHELNVTADLQLGLFSVNYQDKNLTVGRFPITVNRTYDSRRRNIPGDFGYGWYLSLTQAELIANRPAGDGWQQVNLGGFITTYGLMPTKPHLVTVKFGEGEKHQFYARPVPHQQQLYPFTLYGPTGMEYLQLGDDDEGSLVPHGTEPAWFTPDQIVTFDFDLYNPSGFTYTAPDGFQYVFSQGTSSVRYKLTSVTDPSGLTVTLNDNGFTRSDGLSVSFVRDAQGRITRITDPNGNDITYEYDAEGDLVAMVDAETNRTEYRYDSNHYLTETIDPLGRSVQRQEFDADGRLIAITDGNGERVEMEYDLDNNTQIIRDRRGNPAIYEYDGRGNITHETSFPVVNGSVQAVETVRVYDADSQMTSETLPDGTLNTFTYNVRGNVTGEVRDSGGLDLTHSYTYDLGGRMLSHNDARGNEKSWTYDAQGRLITRSDRIGYAWLNTYDGAGNRIRETGPLGNYTLIEYNAQGGVTAKERYDSSDVRLRRMEYAYDANGNKLSQTVIVTVGGTPTAATTTYTYNGNSQRLTQTDPLGHVTQMEYDPVGNRITEIDGLGNRTEYTYNVLGKVTRIDYPDGAASVYGYDADYNRDAVTDLNGNTVNYLFDAANRIIHVGYPDGSNRVKHYDSTGNLVVEIDEAGNRTDHTYDSTGRRTSTTQPLVYDAVADANTQPLTVYEYDANGNRTAVVDANGNRTDYTFDAENHKTHTLYPDGNTAASVYNPAGKETSSTDPMGLTTEYEYDALNRLLQSSLPPPMAGDPSSDTLFGFNEAGNLVSQTDANGHTTLYTYDLAGNRTSRTLPGGQAESFTYDAANRLVGHTDFNGNSTTFGNDERGRRTLILYHDGSSLSVTYNGMGKRLSVVDSRGVTNYEYDNRNRLVRRVDPDGLTLDYAYTVINRLASVATSGGRTTSHSYDALGRLLSTTAADSGVTDFAYDPVGNLVLQEQANGTSTEHAYNNRNQLTSLHNRYSDDNIISAYVYTLDGNGLRTRIDELMGNAVEYVYDDNSRLIRETRVGANAYDHQYSYDAVGNRTEVDKDGAITAYTYDVNDRMTSAGAATYSYDANGNLTGTSEAGDTSSFEYDVADRMVRVIMPGGAVTDYLYDGDGIRVSRTDASGTTRYLVDGANQTGVTQVIEELDGGGALQVNYTYGMDLLSQDRSGAISYYHADGLGSVRGLTNGSETLTDTYLYDAYGNEVAVTGTTENSYRFVGEQYDPNIGFYYLRARYYDPASGRFVSMDPASGDPQSPISLHRYLYANDNPVNYVDPTGEFTLTGMMVAMSIRMNLMKATAPHQIRFFLRANMIAECILRPAYTKFGKAIENMGNNIGGSISMMISARKEIAAGYRALQAAGKDMYKSIVDDLKPDWYKTLEEIYNTIIALKDGKLLVAVGITPKIEALEKYYDDVKKATDETAAAWAAAEKGDVSGACVLFKAADGIWTATETPDP
ncbi:hypothetical protein DJ030_18000 [bacterium endosymbiont of Escarpia laminata]|nr:MAG: hypothetical protein DJ030_18000 [bacterium endosymbiont of Escarpia laminata]